MISPKFICVTCFSGGICAPLFLSQLQPGSAIKTQAQSAKRLRKLWSDYKQDCYKWIYYSPLLPGELAACLYKKFSDDSTSSLVFVLAWFQGSHPRFLAVDSIQWSGGNEISFNFSHPDKIGDLKNSKITINHQLSSLKNNLSHLNGKRLKDICKIEGSNSNQLNCDGGKYTSPTQHVNWYF